MRVAIESELFTAFGVSPSLLAVHKPIQVNMGDVTNSNKNFTKAHRENSPQHSGHSLDFADVQQPCAFMSGISFPSSHTMILAHLSTSHCLNPGCPHRELVYTFRHKAVPANGESLSWSLGLPSGYPPTFAPRPPRYSFVFASQDLSLASQNIKKNPSNLKRRNSLDTEGTFLY